MAVDATNGLSVGGEVAGETSASALPTTCFANAEGPISQHGLFDPLCQAQSSLSQQSEAWAEMHPLNTSLQSLYSPCNTDGELSRDQYRHLISQLRHSVSRFAARSAALKSQGSNSSSASVPQSEDASTAAQLHRYISLLTETSTHTAALAHSIAPFKSAGQSQKEAAFGENASAPLPQRLQAGLLRSGPCEGPCANRQDALETLAALCDTLEKRAQSLGLETFSEPSSDPAAAPSDPQSADTLTHTLTLGAKILVIDVEFHIIKNSAGHGFRPKCKLKLSYATDSPDSQQTRDPRLGLLLEQEVQKIADNLFGLFNNANLQQDRSAVSKALASWTNNLNELLLLDHLEAQASEAAPAGSRSKDLFAAMQELCAAVIKLSHAEASSSTSTALLDRGHGLHQLHSNKPFLHSVFAKDPVSKQEYTVSLGVQALHLPAASPSAPGATSPSFPLSEAANDILAASATSDPARSLGSVASPIDKQKRVPLHFVVRLSPPVVVSRPTAAKLVAICNLKQATPHNTTAAPSTAAPSTAAPSTTAPAGATWFEDVLASSWSKRPKRVAHQDLRKASRCTFTLAQTVESVRSTESQGLIIDSLPLLSASTVSTDAMDESDASLPRSSTLARFFAAIEVLRDEVKVAELMHSAIASSDATVDSNKLNQTTSDELSLDDILSAASEDMSSKIPVTLAFRTPVRDATEEARQSLSLQLTFRILAEDGSPVGFEASVSPSKQASEIGWSLSADVKLPSAAASNSKTARLQSSSAEAQFIASKLSDLDSLEDVVLGLADWAEKQFGIRLKKPAETAASFDPLSYEQQNVHAIYETIAPHFSSTRYKPWPLIPAFLSTIPAGSLGADLGCGNGKYLPIRSTLALSPPSTSGGQDNGTEDLEASKRLNSLLTFGVDRSSNLVALARDNLGMLENAKSKPTGGDDAVPSTTRRQEVAVGDAIHSSLRTGLFDYAISIATIHHFSTWERRRASVQELIRLIEPVDASSSSTRGDGGEVSTPVDPRLKGGSGRGRFMIFVWALEQKDEGKRQFQASDPEILKSKPEIDDPNHAQKSKDRLVAYSGLQAASAQSLEAETKVTDDQDVLVPWVLTTATPKTSKKVKPAPPSKKKGKKGQTSPTEADSGSVKEIQAGLAEIKVEANDEHSKAETTKEDAERPVYNRYYHMFRAGELEALVADAAATMPLVHRCREPSGKKEKVEVVSEASGWERGNWWGVWRVQRSQ
ncbi:uncharacterized protein UDID_07193 [Ustilago sp. UG-2017a]|nr:uncharacterized protein UDID_07193 [Ustilago sp. UG-2017a]